MSDDSSPVYIEPFEFGQVSISFGSTPSTSLLFEDGSIRLTESGEYLVQES